MTKALLPPPATGARARLIEAAGELFGERGYQGATAREITLKAEVNVAAINYYFQDKEALYWEVLRHAVQASLKSDAPFPEDLPAEKKLTAFVTEFLGKVLDPKRPDWHGKLIAREMSSPTRLLDILVESVIRPKGDILRQVIRDLGQSKFTEEQVALICASIMGQCIYYRQNRPVVERLYPDLLKGKDAISKLAQHISKFSLAAIKGLSHDQ